jgi:hypothetical protein
MRVVFALLMLTAATLFAGDGTTNNDVVVERKTLLSAGIIVEQIRLAHPTNDDTMQIWLVSASDPAKRKLLFAHERSAEVVFSPDEKWLFINNYDGSTETTILLFRKKNGLDYEYVDDLTSDAWDFFSQKNKLKESKWEAGGLLDHLYVEVVCWIDSEMVLLRLNGHGDHSNLDDWFCLYDISSKTFTTDFEPHNKQNVRLKPK